jgi:hypothetical protein
MKRIIIFTIIFFLTLNNVFGQEGLKFSAQIRPRLEVDNKDFNSSNKTSTITLMRTRLGVSFNPIENLFGFIQAQDSRTFGEEASTTSNNKNLDVHQAYFKIDNIFNLPLDLKLGRFEAAYGSERFIGSVNWQNNGRSFDGGAASFKSDIINVDLLLVREFEKFFVGDSTDQNIYAIAADLRIIKQYKIQPFLIWQRMQPTDFLNRATLGFYIKGDFENFSHEIDFGFQTGSIISSAKKLNINAYTFSVSVGYSFNQNNQPFIGAQIDIVSGDNNSTDNKFNSYTSLYSSGHKFFGYMDYFVNFPNDTYGLGLVDVVGKIGITLIKDLKLNLNYHLFNSMEDYHLLSGMKSNSFGTELDFVTSYKYNDNVNFECGASLFSAGDIFKEKRGKDTSTWFYLMAVVNF